MDKPNQTTRVVRTGWGSWLARLAMATLLFEAVTGLAITFAPFHAVVQWGVLAHTLVGVVTLLPLAWYYLVHWKDYKGYALSHVGLLGYVGLVALLVCSVSGVVVTWQGLLAVSTSWLWRQVHLVSTFVALIGIELMLNAANLNFIAFWRYSEHTSDASGPMFVVFAIAVAAAEAAVGLALIIAIYRHYKTANLDKVDKLKG